MKNKIYGILYCLPFLLSSMSPVMDNAAQAAENQVPPTQAQGPAAASQPSSPLSATAADGKRLTLQQSVAIAVAKSVVIQSAKEGVAGAEAAKNEAMKNFLPKVSTSYSYQRFNEPPKTKTSEMEVTLPAPYYSATLPSSTAVVGTRDNYIWNVEVKQPIFTGGAIVSHYHVNRIGEEIARTEERIVIQDVERDVKISYFHVLKAQRLLDVARQSLERLTYHREMSKRFFEEGLIARNSFLSADVELASGEYELVSAENNLELARAQFNTLLRRPVGADVELEDVLLYQPYEKTLEACLNQATANRTELQTYLLKTGQAQKLVDAARSEYYPTIHAVGSYELYGDTPDVQGSYYRDRTSWYVLAVASWNLWEWGKTKNRVDVYRSRENQMQCALTNLREQITLEVKSAWLSLREAERRIMVSRTAIIQAEENFKVSQARYKGQLGSATEVLDAQTLLTKSNADYFNALGDYHMNQAKLERAMGTLR